MKLSPFLALAAISFISACTTEPGGGGLQTEAAGVPSAAPQSSGSIRVLELLGPAEGRLVTPNWAAINAQPLGSRGNPVRVLMPAGQHEYLSRLICRDGSRPDFQRKGNVGAGVYGSIVDAYDVQCKSTGYTVYLDMYHPTYVERRPVADFEILPSRRTS